MPNDDVQTTMEIMVAFSGAMDALCRTLASELPTTGRAFHSALEDSARDVPHELSRAREQLAKWQALLSP